MQLIHLLKTLENNAKADLPGEMAQYKLAPTSRIRPNWDTIDQFNPKTAAVGLLLYEKENFPHLLFIKRVDDGGVHGGQIAFPGGKQDLTDKDTLFTALRECYEEVGLEIEKSSLICKLSKLYVPPSNYIIHPYVILVNEVNSWIPNPYEVAEVLEINLMEFSSKAELKTETILVRDFKIETPVFQINNSIIWGASAMILNEFLTLAEMTTN